MTTHSVLDTPRLRLRPIRITDAARIQELFPHWEIVQYMASVIPWPYPDNGAEQFLAAILPKTISGEEYNWAITIKDHQDDQLVGLISLYPNRERDSRGFWLGLPFHNQGYMTEAVAAVNDFAFDELKQTHLMLNNAEPNLASHRLKEKSGATIVEINEEASYVGGKFREIRWKLTREQWAAHRDQF